MAYKEAIQLTQDELHDFEYNFIDNVHLYSKFKKAWKECQHVTGHKMSAREFLGVCNGYSPKEIKIKGKTDWFMDMDKVITNN